MRFPSSCAACAQGAAETSSSSRSQYARGPPLPLPLHRPPSLAIQMCVRASLFQRGGRPAASGHPPPLSRGAAAWDRSRRRSLATSAGWRGWHRLVASAERGERVGKRPRGPRDDRLWAWPPPSPPPSRAKRTFWAAPALVLCPLSAAPPRSPPSLPPSRAKSASGPRARARPAHIGRRRRRVPSQGRAGDVPVTCLATCIRGPVFRRASRIRGPRRSLTLFQKIKSATRSFQLLPVSVSFHGPARRSLAAEAADPADTQHGPSAAPLSPLPPNPPSPLSLVSSLPPPVPRSLRPRGRAPRVRTRRARSPLPRIPPVRVREAPRGRRGGGVGRWGRWGRGCREPKRRKRRPLPLYLP